MFVALVPPDPVIEDLALFMGPRQEAGALRWTLPHQWHITLAFMADVRDRQVDDLIARLQRAARRRSAFQAALAGSGAFPRQARARVLYMGVDAGSGAEELRRLAVGARAAASKAGAGIDGGAIHPHLTLARLRTPMDVSVWLRVLDAYRGPSWQVDQVALIESRLGAGPHGRPGYSTVDMFPLGATADPESTG